MGSPKSKPKPKAKAKAKKAAKAKKSSKSNKNNKQSSDEEHGHANEFASQLQEPLPNEDDYTQLSSMPMDNGMDDDDIAMMEPFEDDNFNHYDSPNLNENDDEKQEIETQRSDDDHQTQDDPTPAKSTRSTKSAKVNKGKAK